jgi:hypothetical protein
MEMKSGRVKLVKLRNLYYIEKHMELGCGCYGTDKIKVNDRKRRKGIY